MFILQPGLNSRISVTDKILDLYRLRLRRFRQQDAGESESAFARMNRRFGGERSLKLGDAQVIPLNL